MRRDNSTSGVASASPLYVKTTMVTVNTGWFPVLLGGSANVTTASPTGTSSATQVMLGLGVIKVLTPAATGSVLVAISGVWKNGTGSGNTMTYTLYTGTGTPPANGAALTGTAQSSSPQATSTGTSVNIPFSIEAVVTGLTPGVACWFDLAFNSSSGTNTLSQVTASAVEI